MVYNHASKCVVDLSVVCFILSVTRTSHLISAWLRRYLCKNGNLVQWKWWKRNDDTDYLSNARIIDFTFLFVCVVWCRTPPLLWSLPVSIHGKRSAGSTPSPRQQHGGPGPAPSADSDTQEETWGFQIRQDPGRGLLLYGTSKCIHISKKKKKKPCRCSDQPPVLVFHRWVMLAYGSSLSSVSGEIMNVYEYEVKILWYVMRP